MRKPTPVEEEVHAIRLALYEEMKDMTPSERVAYVNTKGAAIEAKFGIRAVKAPPPREIEKAL